MIVDPDFFDHWKTQMLVDLSKDDASPLWVLRIWSHAQQRRTGTFETLPPLAIKAITRANSRHRAEQIADWLEAAGFICRNGQQVVIHEWEEYNRGLFANWENGKLGGRPPNPKPKPKPNPRQIGDRIGDQNENPSETHGLPMGNPSETHGKPMANPSGTHQEPIRIEKNRIEEKRGNPDPPCTVEQAKAAAFMAGVKEEEAESWWHARSGSDWTRSDGQGGRVKIANGWRSDMKTYTGNVRNGKAERQQKTGRKPLEYDPDPPTHLSSLSPQEKSECAAFFREEWGDRFTTLNAVPNGEIGNWKRCYRHEAAKAKQKNSMTKTA